MCIHRQEKKKAESLSTVFENKIACIKKNGKEICHQCLDNELQTETEKTKKICLYCEYPNLTKDVRSKTMTSTEKEIAKYDKWKETHKEEEPIVFRVFRAVKIEKSKKKVLDKSLMIV